MSIKFYPRSRDKLRALLIFLATIILWLVPVTLQWGKPFSHNLFFVSFFLMFPCTMAAYYLLKLHLSPVVQIHSREIIISGFKRTSIPLVKVDHLRIYGQKLELLYHHGETTRKLQMKVSNRGQSITIVNGKIISGGHFERP